MSLFQTLTEKPWLVGQGTIVDLRAGPAFRMPKVTLGLRIFLAVVTVVFTLLVVAYLDRMAIADWRPVPEPLLMWLNIIVLFASSVAMQWAANSARRGNTGNVEAGMLIGGACALAFLAGQIMVARQLDALGFFVPTNPALAFLYLLTALHGIHLLGGLVVLGRSVLRIWKGYEVHQVRTSV